MKRNSQQLGYFYFVVVAILLALLATSCASPEEAARDAAEWNDFMSGALMLTVVLCACFFVLLGFTALKEWLKKH